MTGKLVIAAGGTGGHMFPAQALAETMLARGWQVRLSTDPRGARYSGNFPEAVTRAVVSSGTFGRPGLASKLRAPFQIAFGVLTAWWRMRRERPDMVVGFGGYPAIPAMSAAYFLGLPRLIHEQNGVLGRVNALFVRRVHKVACSVWPTELPSDVDAVHTGNPVRSVVRDLAGAKYDLSGEGPLRILVIGGSQGASILSRVVPDALISLPEGLRARLEVSHQARDADAQNVERSYREAGIPADIQGFFEDVPARLVNAHLVISRSGASSVADIAAIGRPSVLIPLAAAIRDEQTANARGFEDVGAATIIQERDLSAKHLAQIISDILTQPARAETMAARAASLGRPDAVETLADLVEKIAAAKGKTP